MSAYLSPGAQDQRDAILNRFSRGVESVDWNTKLLVAMMRYQIVLDLSSASRKPENCQRAAGGKKFL